MMYHDEDLLVQIPCEFCDVLYPLYQLTEHQTGCRPDLVGAIEPPVVHVTEPTVEEIEAQFFNLEVAAYHERNITNFSEAPNMPETLPPQQNILPIVNAVATPNFQEEKKSSETTQQINNGKEFPTDDHFEIPEEDILQGDKTTFTFGSTKKGKREEEEEKPSFKAPPNPILNNDSKQFIHNHLTESDNEDGESLEDFWKRADIKLSQRLRMMEKKTADRKF